MKKGYIILLNGVSSAGKTTLSKVIQDKLNVPYYRICCDDFMHMTPPQILHDDFDNQLLVTQGIMHEVIRLFSDNGQCVVVDDVILELPDKNDWLYEYSVMLEEYPVMFVHVICPLHELIRRQTERGDRHSDQAQWQLAHTYTDIPYDITVNTFENSTEACAEQIITFLNESNAWTALNKIKKSIETTRGA